MSNISKCENLECPIKERCYRYTSTPLEHWQSYTNFKYNKITENCDFFLNNDVYKGYEVKELKNGN